MEEQHSTISVKQLIIIYLIAVSSPLIRIIPKNVSLVAKDGSILTPILVIIPFLLLLYILNVLINKSGEKSLQDVYIKIFGKFIGNIILILHIVWIFILISIYVRYFADRYASTILIFTPIHFFILTILITAFIVVRRKIEYFARTLEIFALLFSLVVVALFVISLIDVKISNIYPLTVFDALDSLKSVPLLLGILSYITFMFFLGEEVSNKQDLKKYTKYITTKITFFNFFVILSTIGIFGYTLTSEFNLPFFMFLKNIQLITVVERFESIFISFWFVTDFAIITLFIYIISKLIKKVGNLEHSITSITPIIFGTFTFSLYIVSSTFELYKFSDQFLLYINIGFAVIIPIIAFIVGKIRKMI